MKKIIVSSKVLENILNSILNHFPDLGPGQFPEEMTVTGDHTLTSLYLSFGSDKMYMPAEMKESFTDTVSRKQLEQLHKILKVIDHQPIVILFSNTHQEIVLSSITL
jgi:hypothetical protein